MSTVEEILATPGAQSDDAPGWHDCVPEPDGALMDTERLKAAFLRATGEVEGVRHAMHDLDEMCEGAAEAFPKVVQCYGCDEYAFDGCFTAYQTDEGVQGFCPECVRGIQQRSEKPEPAGVYVGDKLVGNATGLSIDWGYGSLSSHGDLYASPRRSFEISGYMSPDFDSSAFTSLDISAITNATFN